MIGIDEVGRGCWAGPLLVVAARATGILPEGLTDSKKLTKRARERYAEQLLEVCEIGEGWVSPGEIDKLGLTDAMRLAVMRALRALRAKTGEEIIMDGNFNYCSFQFRNVTCLIKADAVVPVVSAASIIAKVKRDAFMTNLASVHLNYGFDKHVGYGTPQHIEALKAHGVTSLHRLSYKPVQKYGNI